MCRSDSDSGSGGSASAGSASTRQPKPTPKRAASSARLQQLMHQGGLLRKLRALQHLTAPEAAIAMSCSVEGFRKLCRSIGISRWPSLPRSRGTSE